MHNSFPVAIWQKPIINLDSNTLAIKSSDTNSFPVVIWKNPTLHSDSCTLAIEASDTNYFPVAIQQNPTIKTSVTNSFLALIQNPAIHLDSSMLAIKASVINSFPAVIQNPNIHLDSSMLAIKASNTKFFPIVIWQNPTIHSTLAIDASDTRCISHAPLTTSFTTTTTTTKTNYLVELKSAICSVKKFNVIPPINSDVVIQFTSTAPRELDLVKASTTVTILGLTDESWELGPLHTSSTDVGFVEYSTEREQAVVSNSCNPCVWQSLLHCYTIQETKHVSKVHAVVCFTITLVAAFLCVMTALFRKERSKSLSF